MNFNRTFAQRLQLRRFGYGSFITVLLLVSIYSSSWSIILSAILGLFWMLSARFMALPVIIKEKSSCCMVIAFFPVFYLGVSYRNVPFGEAFPMMMKYRELLFIPVLNHLWRHNVFVFGNGKLLLSYLRLHFWCPAWWISVSLMLTIRGGCLFKWAHYP